MPVGCLAHPYQGLGGPGTYYVDHAGLERTKIHLLLSSSAGIKGVYYHAWLTF